MYKRTLAQSFRLAFSGLRFVLRTERNMKVHCLFAAIAIISSFFFRVSGVELLFVIFSIALVFITEAANTAFELLLDFIHGDRYHPDVKLLKDIAAGGVFVAALNAFFIGLFIFCPKFIDLVKKVCALIR